MHGEPQRENYRLAVHEQSTFNLLRQNGCRVTKVYGAITSAIGEN